MGVGSFILPQIGGGVKEWQRPTDWLPMPTNITSADDFVGNNFRSKNHAKELDLRNGGHPTASGAIIGNIVIDERSYGNNVSELNK